MNSISDGRKLREYQGLWLRIAAADSAASVVVLCPASFSKRLIQAVRKEKAAANAIRKNFDMPLYGKMFSDIRAVDKRQVSISFYLSYNGDKL